MKIPFTLDAWLKDKSQKVETRDGRFVHNIWQIKEPHYINNRRAEVCALIDGEEDALVFFEGGRYLPTTKDADNQFDLFILTPEPELSEFENKLRVICEDAVRESQLFPERTSEDFAKKHSAELLALARKELREELQTHKDHSDSFMGLAISSAYERGKAEALKDLPRWRKWGNGACGNGRGIPLAIVKRGLNGYELVDALGIQGEQYIMLSDLEKLSGFNE